MVCVYIYKYMDIYIYIYIYGYKYKYTYIHIYIYIWIYIYIHDALDQGNHLMEETTTLGHEILEDKSSQVTEVCHALQQRSIRSGATHYRDTGALFPSR